MSKFPSKVIKVKAVYHKEGKRTASVLDINGVRYMVWKDYQGETTHEYNQLTPGNHNEAFKSGIKLSFRSRKVPTTGSRPTL